MKQLFGILFFVIATETIVAQDFCGLIRYQYRYYKPKNKEVTSRIKDVKTEDFYICGNNFKVYFDGKLKDVFIGDSLTYFIGLPDSIFLYLKADTVIGNKNEKYNNLQKGVSYKNRTYTSIELKKDNIIYYFNEDVRIDPTLFKNVNLFHWNAFFKATNGALRLVAISRTWGLITISEAVEIKRMDPKDMDFRLPMGYKVKPYLSAF